MTKIPLEHYSGSMISDFQLLSEKINELAELTQSLRRENAELRRHSIALAAENADLARRMEEAQQRLIALLEKIPAFDTDQEAA